jgi:hypothetical protein
MKHIKLFESFGKGSFTQELPPRATLSPNEFGFVELCNSDTGDCALGIIDGKELDWCQDLMDTDFIASKILKCLEEGEITNKEVPTPSYYVRKLDQSMLSGRKDVLVSFFTPHRTCNSKTEEVLMGYRNDAGIKPNKKVDGNLTVYSGMFTAGKDTVIAHTGDNYLLQHAPLQKIGDWPGEHRKGCNCTYTFPFEIGVLYNQPYPGEPYNEGTGELMEQYYFSILDNFITGEYDPSDWHYEDLKMNVDLLKEIFKLLVDDPRATKDILDLLATGIASNEAS